MTENPLGLLDHFIRLKRRVDYLQARLAQLEASAAPPQLPDFRVQSAAYYLRHHPMGSAELLRVTRQRYGLTSAEAFEARAIADEMRAAWP